MIKTEQVSEIEQILSTYQVGTMLVEKGITGPKPLTIEATQAISDLITKARIDEVKKAMYKGYYIPEMEVMAEGRISKLQRSLTNKEE